MKNSKITDDKSILGIGPNAVTTEPINAIIQLLAGLVNAIQEKINEKNKDCDEKGPRRWMLLSLLGATSNAIKQ